MKNLLCVLILIISLDGNSQNQFNSEDLSVTRSDLTINTYEKDSTANAMILYEHGKSYIDRSSFALKTEVKKKLKILNKQGYDKANISIYLYNNGSKKEKVKNITATTYNLENNSVSKTSLDKSQIFEEKYNDNYTIIKFAFPNIKEGSVIVYNYTLETPFMFKYKEWYFQDDIPKLYSQYETSIPGNYEYHIKLVGYLKLDVNTSRLSKSCLEVGNGGTADCMDVNYVMRDVPAFIEEDFMTTKTNYISRVEYELKTFRGFDGSVNHYTKSWESVDSELKTDKNIGRQLNKSNAVKDLLSPAITSENDFLTKAKAIYNYVQENYTWNNKYDIFTDVSIKDLVENKSGKISEINILLHNLLEENGIDVKPILLSTRNNGFATLIYPVLSDFNYLIVQATINGDNYLLDATDKYLPFGMVPFRCLNQEGRVLDFKKGSNWIDIKVDDTSIINYRNDLSLTKDGKLEGIVEKKTSGYHALSLKQAYFENKGTYFNSIKEKNNFIELTNHSVETENKTDFDFKEEFTIAHEIESVGDKIYLNPFLFKFFTENFFKLQERTYPIDFGYKDSYNYTLKLTIDDGYEVIEQPKDVVLKLPNNKGNLIFTCKTENNVMVLYFKLSFYEALYNPEYYPSIKEFMANAVDIQKNSLIVLKRI